ncbi:RICIN domain-containing protein [Streptomyces sp. NEAU-174]|uniref:RICIN domain-containing protein n=1 Tax=Streptomyces sp. NEAU-174 TaxID=3458254 RepID=UPI004044C635
MSGARALRGLWAAPVAVLALLAGSLATAGATFAVPAERHAPAAVLYVAPGADPGGDGTAERPFATIDQAQRPAHQLSADSDVVVHLAGGTYRLSEPLAFGPGDGGQNGHTITYQGVSGQQPVVTGARRLEATRNHWVQMPAAVQVSAATGNTFTDIAGSGIQVGGIQPDAHHPGNPQMTNHDITVSNNRVSGVGTDDKETAGILSTYVTNATITHNQCDHLPYDGIDIGWGWGINDPGGSQDYVNRGTYAYQPVYSTPTTLKNNTVSHNLVFDTKKAMFDGGSIYSLSASPGSAISDNYMYGNNHTDDSTFSGNWYNGGNTYVATGPPHNNVLTGNVLVGGTNWPQGARQVIQQAGVQSSGGGGGFPTGYHQLVIGSDSLCLDVYGNSTSAGAAIDQWTCNGQSNQDFTPR